jgi:hypothetical protein
MLFFFSSKEMNFLDSIQRCFGCFGEVVSRTLAVVDAVRPGQFLYCTEAWLGI